MLGFLRSSVTFEPVRFGPEWTHVPAPGDRQDAVRVESGPLAGKTLGAQSSTTHSNYAEAKFPSTDLKLYPTADEYQLDIASGRIDAVIDDVIVLSEWLKTDDGACCKLLATLPIDPVINGEGAGIAVRKGEDALREKFNTAIDAIRANGTYKEINDKYFDVDVYGD